MWNRKIIIFFILTLVGCKINSADVNKGKAIYYANCITCHGDPNFGSMAPAIINADKELLYYKVIKGTYPVSYFPKRKTKLMPVMPELENEIQFIDEYLKYKRNFE